MKTRLSIALNKIKLASAQEDFADMYYKGKVVFPVKFNKPTEYYFSTYAIKDENDEIKYIIEGFDGFRYDEKAELVSKRFSSVDELLEAIRQFIKKNTKGKEIKVQNPYLEE